MTNLARDIRLQSRFIDYKADTDREDHVRVSASGNAGPGTYALEVEQLATAQVQASTGRASRDTPEFDGGELLITIDGN